MQAKVCGEYKIVNPEKFQFEHVRDLPLEACQGVFGFKDTDIAAIIDWSEDMQNYVKNKCQPPKAK